MGFCSQGGSKGLKGDRHALTLMQGRWASAAQPTGLHEVALVVADVDVAGMHEAPVQVEAAVHRRAALPAFGVVGVAGGRHKKDIELIEAMS